MLRALLVFTFAGSAFGSASAPITTSAWMYAPGWITDKVGYVGAVIEVHGDRTTMLVKPDERSDATALNRYRASSATTVTIAPTYYGEGLTVRTDFLSANTAISVEEAGRLDCTKSATGDVGALCTMSYGPILGYLNRCRPAETVVSETVTVAATITHTYPSRGSYPAGTETLTVANTISPFTTSTPSWCNGNATASVDMRSSTTFSEPKERFPTAQLIIERGEEKLPATSTSSKSAATKNRGASVPLQTAGPVVAGLAVAAAFVV